MIERDYIELPPKDFIIQTEDNLTQSMFGDELECTIEENSELCEALTEKSFNSLSKDEANDLAAKEIKVSTPLLRYLEYPSYEEIDSHIQKHAGEGKFKIELEIIPINSYNFEFSESLKIFQSLGYRVTKEFVYGKRPIENIVISWE